MNYHLARAARAVNFAFGALRAEPHLPWFSTGQRRHKVSLVEAFEALTTARFGDVGLHREDGCFTNLAIPGAMKHAWIHTADVYSDKHPIGGTIVEATADGVLSKSALTPYLTDYAVLLRPRGLTEEQIKGACIKCREIEGAEYDTNFRFDIEHEMEFYENPANAAHARDVLHDHERAMQRWNYAFSCSETVAYAYWHVRETLQISRRSIFGRLAILPQDFLDFEFDIVWASSSLTMDAAKRWGFSDIGLEKLARYQKGVYQ